MPAEVSTVAQLALAADLKTDNPWIREEGRLFLRYDAITIENRRMDPGVWVSFGFKGVIVSRMAIEDVRLVAGSRGLQLTGLDGRMGADVVDEPGA